MKKLYALAVLVLSLIVSNAQISKGKDFWLGFMDNLIVPELRVVITSETATSGTVSVPLTGWSQTFTVVPGVSTLVVVPNADAFVTADDQIVGMAVHVTTNDCVSVFAQNYGSYSSDATVVFPVNSLGSSYNVLTYEDNGNFDGESEFLIAASMPNTSVTITLPVNENGHTAGVPYTILLDTGQVYQLKADLDLTGTIISANKNVAVYAGNTCVEIGGCQYCDHIFEQMYPIPSWGKEFITVPYLTRADDYFRVLANYNSTQITVNGGPVINLNAGQTYNFSSGTVNFISSNNDVAVGQFSKGDNCDAGESGDPFYIILSPVSQSINTVTFNTLPSSVGGFQWYLNLVVKTVDIPTVTLNGAAIAPASFTPSAQNPTYSTAQLTIPNGDHTVSAAQGVEAYVYGYADDESFGYAAGVRVQIPILSVYDSTNIICPNDYVPLTLNTPDTARTIYIEWNYGDGSPHTIGTFYTGHTYTNYGDYPITIIYELMSACKRDTMTIDTVKVRGPNVIINGPTQFCAPQTGVVLSAVSQFAVSGLLWSTGATGNSITINVPNDTIVTITAANATCAGYDTARIYVGSDTAGFTFSNSCEGTPTVFTNTSKIIPNALYTWQWDFGDGGTSGLASPQHQYAAGGTYQVKLKFVSPAGCSDSITQPVTIYAKPVAAIIVNRVCNDSVLTPVNNSTISSGSMTFAWNFGDGSPISTAQYPTHEYALSGGYNISLTVTSGPGCFDTISRPNNINIGADVQFAGVNVCLGAATQFNDLTFNSSGSAILSYNWDFGDGTTSNQLSPSHTYAADGSYLVTLLLDYGSNCYDSVKHTVFVKPVPVADFTVADLCNNGTTLPANTSSVSSGSLNLNWSFGDGTAIVTGNAPSHTYAQSGNYNIQLIAVSDSSCADTLTKPIRVIRGALINFTAPAVCAGASTTFTNQTTNPYNTTINGYSWDFGDGASSSLQNTSHTYSTSGTFNAELKLDYGNNCADSLTKVITINENPAASFTVSDVCNGNVVIPNNTSTVSTGTMTHSWLFGDGSAAVTGMNPSHSYAMSNTYSIQLITSTAAGCADTVSNPVLIIRGTLIDFSAPAVCAGTSTTFTNQTTNPYNTIINGYSWDFGDGASSSLQNTSHTYSTSGTFNAELKLDYGNNCADSLTKVISVNENPIASFTVADVCNGNVVTPNNTSTISAGTMNHSWLFGDGSAAVTGSNPSHQYAMSNTYSIQLITSTAAGCADTVSNPINVIRGAVIDFTVPAICEGTASTFTDATSNPYNTTITGFAWDFGDGTTSVQQNTSHNYAAFGNYTVELKLNYGNNCWDSISKPITVNQNPSADFTSTIPCIGNNMQITDASTPVGSITAWAWNLGDGTTTSSQNGNHVYSAAGNYNVELIVTSSAGCKDTVAKQVSVLDKANAQFSAPDVCLYNSTSFTNTTNITTYPVNSFVWNFGDGTGTSTLTDPSYTYSSSGIYPVTIIANFTNGCSDTSTQQVEVFVLPTVTSSVQDVLCFGGNDGSIQLTPVIGATPFSYNWSNGTASATAGSLTQGNYQVTFTDANTCTASGTFTINEPSQLQIDTASTPVTCFGYNDASITIIASNGTPAYSYIWNNGGNTAIASQLNAGAYSVTVTDSKGCSASISMSIINPPAYTILLDTIATINLGQTVILSPVAINGNPVSWLWTPTDYLSCATCQTTEAGPYYNYFYQVQSTDDKGCLANASVQVIVVPKYEVFIPNVFTPNGDGSNDYFEVFGNKEAWKQFEVQLFNRIGEKVYESNDMNFKWDGTYKGIAQNPAVYVYLVKVIYLNNYTEKLFKGSVTLVR
ncbi:MAG: PKD domain-containing protein [Chitinophagales bacterium]